LALLAIVGLLVFTVVRAWPSLREDVQDTPPGAGVAGLWAEAKGFTQREIDDTLAALDAARSSPDPAAAPPAYERAKFGPAWADTDHNGCDTRDDVLKRDLAGVKLKDGDGCVVTSGLLTDPYTGALIVFKKGEDTSAMVQIDHVVPLKAAWDAGAWAWTDQRRLEFANDQAGLLAVDGAQNEAKGAKGPSQWLPPEGVCEYVLTYARTAGRWGLVLPRADRDAIVAAAGERCQPG
jgi:hypothetical protein